MLILAFFNFVLLKFSFLRKIYIVKISRKPGEFKMDKFIFQLINRYSGRYPLMDLVMIFFSKRVRYLYILVLVILWCNNKPIVKKAVISNLLSWIIRIISNKIYFRPRPFVSNRVGILIPSKTDSTYFSKHTLLSFAISTTLAIHYRVLGAILLIFATLTGFSRIWVGHHYPSDIIRSALVGGSISLLVERLYPVRKFIK